MRWCEFLWKRWLVDATHFAQNDQLVVLGGDEAARGREGDLATEAEEALFDLLQDSQQKVDRKLPVLATSVVQQSAGSTAGAMTEYLPDSYI